VFDAEEKVLLGFATRVYLSILSGFIRMIAIGFHNFLASIRNLNVCET